jgi:hypothetical protein
MERRKVPKQSNGKPKLGSSAGAITGNVAEAIIGRTKEMRNLTQIQNPRTS